MAVAEQTAKVPRSVKAAMLVSAVLTVSALVGAALLREGPTASGGAPGGGQPYATTDRLPTSAVTAAPALRCGAGPCVGVDSTTVGSTKVDLLADASGAFSRVRFDEGGDSGLNVHETLAISLGGQVQKGALSCLAGSKYQACLVVWGHPNESSRTGTLYVKPPSRPWVRVESTYSSDQGVLQLRDVNDDGVPEVLAVDAACDGIGNSQACKQFVLRVINNEGGYVGCTKPVNKKELLPGWPNNLSATRQQLKECT